MKKALTILMGLAVVLGSFGFSSCNQKEEGKKTESPLQVGQVQDMEGYRKIYDFESQDEINSIKAFWDFGKMPGKRRTRHFRKTFHASRSARNAA